MSRKKGSAPWERAHLEGNSPPRSVPRPRARQLETLPTSVEINTLRTAWRCPQRFTAPPRAPFFSCFPCISWLKTPRFPPLLAFSLLKSGPICKPSFLFFQLAPGFHQTPVNIDDFSSKSRFLTLQKIAFFVKFPFLRNGNCQFFVRFFNILTF